MCNNLGKRIIYIIHYTVYTHNVHCTLYTHNALCTMYNTYANHVQYFAQLPAVILIFKLNKICMILTIINGAFIDPRTKI